MYSPAFFLYSSNRNTNSGLVVFGAIVFTTLMFGMMGLLAIFVVCGSWLAFLGYFNDESHSRRTNRGTNHTELTERTIKKKQYNGHTNCRDDNSCCCGSCLKNKTQQLLLDQVSKLSKEQQQSYQEELDALNQQYGGYPPKSASNSFQLSRLQLLYEKYGLNETLVMCKAGHFLKLIVLTSGSCNSCKKDMAERGAMACSECDVPGAVIYVKGVMSHVEKSGRWCLCLECHKECYGLQEEQQNVRQKAIANKHPDESYGEFYTRKGRGLTYDEAMRGGLADPIIERTSQPSKSQKKYNKNAQKKADAAARKTTQLNSFAVLGDID